MSHLLDTRPTGRTPEQGLFFVEPDMLPSPDVREAIDYLAVYPQKLRAYKSVQSGDIAAAEAVLNRGCVGVDNAIAFLESVEALKEAISHDDLAEGVVAQGGEELADKILTSMVGQYALLGRQVYYRDGEWLTTYDTDQTVVYFNRADVGDEIGSREATIGDYIALISHVETQFLEQAAN